MKSPDPPCPCSPTEVEWWLPLLQLEGVVSSPPSLGASGEEEVDGEDTHSGKLSGPIPSSLGSHSGADAAGSPGRGPKDVRASQQGWGPSEAGLTLGLIRCRELGFLFVKGCTPSPDPRGHPAPPPTIMLPLWKEAAEQACRALAPRGPLGGARPVAVGAFLAAGESCTQTNRHPSHPPIPLRPDSCSVRCRPSPPAAEPGGDSGQGQGQGLLLGSAGGLLLQQGPHNTACGVSVPQVPERPEELAALPVR